MTRAEAQARIIEDLKAHLQMHALFGLCATQQEVATEMLARLHANVPLAVEQDATTPTQS